MEKGKSDSHSGTQLRLPKPNVESHFDPQLKRTKEVLCRPEWIKHSGEAVPRRGSLGTFALFGILFANCVGGGYGFEDGIGAAGPLITLIVCAILPWLWCYPTGLAVAELSTSVPSNSGILMWGNASLPTFVSFFSVLLTVFVTFIGNASYPSLTSEYAVSLKPDMNKGAQAGIKIAVIMICFVLNAVGIEIVGSASIILCAITILPFSLLTVIRLFAHGFNKAVLHVNVKSVNWASFFSIISWNYANIENSGAMIEEVADPAKSFPIAMVLLMFSTYVAYVMPMLAGVSAMADKNGEGEDFSQWKAGHWPDVAKVVAGDWLRYMLFAGAMLSGIGFTLTAMCTTSRLLAGIGTMEVFPKKVSRILGYYHPKLGTPIPAIALNTAFMIVFSCALDFGDVVSLCQSFYNLRMLVIYSAVMILRIKYPRLPRPYKLPCNNLLCFFCLLPAAMFSMMASIVSAMTSLAIGMAYVGSVVGGLGLSWVYCHFLAPHGFQGTIVTCDVAAEDEDGLHDENAPLAVDEGIFYAEGDDMARDDLLLGILPTLRPESGAPMVSEPVEPSKRGSPRPPSRQASQDNDVFREDEEMADHGAVVRQGSQTKLGSPVVQPKNTKTD